MPKIRVVLADDHAVFREGLASLLSAEKDLSVAGQAASAEEAVKVTAKSRADVLVVDMEMPGASGLEAIAAVHTAAPSVQVIVLSGHVDGPTVKAALAAGAAGYLSKQETAKSIVSAIHAVMRGEKALSPQASASLAAQLESEAGAPAGQQQHETHGLTDREIEILRHIAMGKTNAQIGAELFLSESTIKNHVYNLYRKLAVLNRSSAVLRALEMGLIDTDGSG
jgi:DNA-binding NarL/FixJ family response regulator